MKKSADKPKHAPAAKHTLEEVLRNLQDLVRNELAQNGPEQAAAKPAGRKAKAEKPAVQPEPAKANAEKAAAPPPGGIQVELSLPRSQAPRPPVAVGKVEPEESAVRQFKANSPSPSKPAAKKPKPPEQAAIKWDDEIPVLNDDIPVLQNVVMPPANKAASRPNSVSSSSERARAIAVRVAAKLNSELRKAGHPMLDPAMIEKLEHLLREALESRHPNNAEE